MLISFYCL